MSFRNMLQQPIDVERVLHIGAWVVFGPITGVMLGLALKAFKAGRPARGWAFVALNFLILLAIPSATALIATTL